MNIVKSTCIHSFCWLSDDNEQLKASAIKKRTLPNEKSNKKRSDSETNIKHIKHYSTIRSQS